MLDRKLLSNAVILNVLLTPQGSTQQAAQTCPSLLEDSKYSWASQQPRRATSICNRYASQEGGNVRRELRQHLVTLEGDTARDGQEEGWGPEVEEHHVTR